MTYPRLHTWLMSLDFAYALNVNPVLYLLGFFTNRIRPGVSHVHIHPKNFRHHVLFSKRNHQSMLDFLFASGFGMFFFGWPFDTQPLTRSTPGMVERISWFWNVACFCPKGTVFSVGCVCVLLRWRMFGCGFKVLSWDFAFFSGWFLDWFKFQL